MSGNRKMIFDQEFYCTRCGKKGIPLGKEIEKTEEEGRLQRLFCFSCNKETNHAEVVRGSRYDKKIFIDELKSGNFDKQGNRLIPLKEWKILYYGSFEWISEEFEDDDIEDDEMVSLFHYKNKVSA